MQMRCDARMWGSERQRLVWRGPVRSGLVRLPKEGLFLFSLTPLLFFLRERRGGAGQMRCGRRKRREMVEALLLSRSGLGPLLDELAPMRVWPNGAWAGRGEGCAAGRVC